MHSEKNAICIEIALVIKELLYIYGIFMNQMCILVFKLPLNYNILVKNCTKNIYLKCLYWYSWYI